jgi:hypothetical protein
VRLSTFVDFLSAYDQGSFYVCKESKKAQSRFLAQNSTNTNTHLLITIALLTWAIYNANRRKEHSMFSKAH